MMTRYFRLWFNIHVNWITSTRSFFTWVVVVLVLFIVTRPTVCAKKINVRESNQFFAGWSCSAVSFSWFGKKSCEKYMDNVQCSVYMCKYVCIYCIVFNFFTSLVFCNVTTYVTTWNQSQTSIVCRAFVWLQKRLASRTRSRSELKIICLHWKQFSFPVSTDCGLENYNYVVFDVLVMMDWLLCIRHTAISSDSGSLTPITYRDGKWYVVCEPWTTLRYGGFSLLLRSHSYNLRYKNLELIVNYLSYHIFRKLMLQRFNWQYYRISGRATATIWERNWNIFLSRCTVSI